MHNLISGYDGKALLVVLMAVVAMIGTATGII